jgi:hypothetical protein
VPCEGKEALVCGFLLFVEGSNDQID